MEVIFGAARRRRVIDGALPNAATIQRTGEVVMAWVGGQRMENSFPGSGSVLGVVRVATLTSQCLQGDRAVSRVATGVIQATFEGCRGHSQPTRSAVGG
jgi:hypothetical protein